MAGREEGAHAGASQNVRELRAVLKELKEQAQDARSLNRVFLTLAVISLFLAVAAPAFVAIYSWGSEADFKHWASTAGFGTLFSAAFGTFIKLSSNCVKRYWDVQDKVSSLMLLQGTEVEKIFHYWNTSKSSLERAKEKKKFGVVRKRKAPPEEQPEADENGTASGVA